jgi:hypothetical protein
MTIRTPAGETFVGRVEADEHGVVWLIDAEGVRYQLAVVFRAAGAWTPLRPSSAAPGARVRERVVAVKESWPTVPL